MSTFAIIIERGETGSYGAWCPDLPGCVAHEGFHVVGDGGLGQGDRGGEVADAGFAFGLGGDEGEQA